MTTAIEPTMMGATVVGAETEFRVWAPNAARVALRLFRRADDKPFDVEMARDSSGNFSVSARAQIGDRYAYVVDGSQPLPDPVSRFLPEGVHGATEIVDPVVFPWTDAHWGGLSLDQYIVYELHVGAFTPEGTLDAIIPRLDYLKNGLGITAIEIMPVAAFPGTRNWGYDGVSPYAVQASYGGPEALRRLVDASHAIGLAVVLDVVYNHFGPEGNYLRQFGPYFTDKHGTPWGDAVNYDQAGSEGVRRYVVENALYWLREYHIDGLRLDAIQTIHDDSGAHITAEIAEAAHRYGQENGRTICVISETDENDARFVRARAAGGRGIDALWSDDFHHAVHAYFTGERRGYYQDFGEPEQIVKALTEGFVYQGEAFQFWSGRSRGTPCTGMPPQAHVICIQNHDQVGNRAKGDRLTGLMPRGARFVAAALLLLAPQTPLLFMGQEWDEPAPFQFFTNFGDPNLKKAVSEGRRNEFKDFDFSEVPDPEDPATFQQSKIEWKYGLTGDSKMLKWHRELIALRKRIYGIGNEERRQVAAPPAESRSCRASLHDGGAGISVHIPAEDPKILITASLKAGVKFEGAAGWRELLWQEEDGYRVAVYERA